MTKQTYLRRLRKALRGVPSRERENCIDYYAELIDDAFERGKTSREVFNELEAPEEAAEKLKGELSHRDYDYDDRDDYDDRERGRRDYDDFDDDDDRDRRERERDRRDRERDRRDRERDRRERERDRRDRERDRRDRERDDYDDDDDRDDREEEPDKPSVAARVIGILLGLPLAFAVIVLLVSLFASALSIVVSGLHLAVFSIGLMFSDIASGFIQLGIGIASFGLGCLLFTLFAPIARGLWALVGFLFRGFRSSGKPRKKRFKAAHVAVWLSIFVLGGVLFVAAYGSVGFDRRRFAVTGDVEELEWTLEEEYGDLKLDLENFGLRVEKGEVEYPVFQYRQTAENPKTFTYAEGTLSVAYENSRSKWFGNVREQWKRGVFFHMVESDLNELILTLPMEYADDFEVISDNGAVALEGLTLGDVKLDLKNGAVRLSACTLSNLSVSAENGAVSVKELRAETVTLKTRNGVVNVETLEANTLTAQTNNGAIHVADVKANVLEFKTENGAVKAERAVAERVSAETDNGYIGMNQVDAKELRLTTENGMIAGELAGRVEDYSIVRAYAERYL